MHRDLKPDNILIDKQTGKVKITNFTSAAKINASEYIFEVYGSPGYIAPEVFTCKKDDPTTFYNDKWKMFSAGCIFFHLLFKHPLCDTSNSSITLMQNKDEYHIKGIKYVIRNEINNKDRQINQNGIDLLCKLLEFDKNKRISAQEALAHPYFQSEIPQTLNQSFSKLHLQENMADNQSSGLSIHAAKNLNLSHNQQDSTETYTPTLSPNISYPVSSITPKKIFFSLSSSDNTHRELTGIDLNVIEDGEGSSKKEEEQSKGVQVRKRKVCFPWLKVLFKSKSS